MGISFDKALGIHEAALQLRSMRQVLISNNIANADTPGYQASDIDFQALLQQIQMAKGTESGKSGHMLPQSTHPKHLLNDSHKQNLNLLYRAQLLPSQDGNTVDAAQEYVKFAENSMRYQASLNFLAGKFNGMLNAIKGGK